MVPTPIIVRRLRMGVVAARNAGVAHHARSGGRPAGFFLLLVAFGPFEDADRSCFDRKPPLARAIRVGRENTGSVGAAKGVDAIAAGGRAGWRRQLTAAHRAGEGVVCRHIEAAGVVGGDVGCVGSDINRRGQVHGLPPACCGVVEGGAGEARRPQISSNL
jgi:hypothetical protein